ncbi:transglycosylase SLT domain-containing protein [Paracoccus sp. MA]|uniref:transglycosylase SLT domain-containing protein n=1 Tax=Paracoccus sp. MA TaxID=2895796 RepID=UPI001E28D29E|nr:transglycosylase SLT domain-containing protein [Paracoccus sp. MA]UFM65256.1 transglycosylase SLT domain-containing protein [Paracoccus sp. MA]
MRPLTALVLILALSACELVNDVSQPPAASASPPITFAADWDGRTEGAQWTAFTRQALATEGKALLAIEPTDVDAYCPAYAKLSGEEREAFWLGLLSAMARFESGFRPATSYEESFNDSNGNPVISRGLLQLSHESANGYRCGIEDAERLHDPRTNLTCGVRIMNRLVSRDSTIGTQVNRRWRGGAAYWSVLRTTSGSNSKIRAYTTGLAICQG